jgi:DNA-binding MarR family transcriptional regulator
LRLTEAGAAALAECDVQTRAWLCRALSGMDAKQLQRIQDSLRDLRSALTAEEPPGK